MAWNRLQAALLNARKRNRAAVLADDKGSHAWGTIVFASNPSSAQTVTLGGTVVTFGTDVTIGANLGVTLANLITYLSASANAGIAQAAYNLGTLVLPGFASITLPFTGQPADFDALALVTTGGEINYDFFRDLTSADFTGSSPTTVKVQVGATVADTVTNLAAAINSGTSTPANNVLPANPDLSAVANGASITLTAKLSGTAGNAFIAAGQTTVPITFPNATLISGVLYESLFTGGQAGVGVLEVLAKKPGVATMTLAASNATVSHGTLQLQKNRQRVAL